MGFGGSGKHQQKMNRKLAPNISLEMLLWCCGIFRIPFEILPQYPTHAWKIVEPDQVAQSALTNFPLHLRTNNGKCFLLSRYSKTSQWVIFVSHFKLCPNVLWLKNSTCIPSLPNLTMLFPNFGMKKSIKRKPYWLQVYTKSWVWTIHWNWSLLVVSSHFRQDVSEVGSS